MATEEQVRANRENGQKSTGPRTPEGKARSSRNALTHSLLSREIPNFGEDAEKLNALREGMIDDLAPEGMLEELLVDRAVDQVWRLGRAARMERVAIDNRYYNEYEAKRPLDEMNAAERLELADTISARLLRTDEFYGKLVRYEGSFQRGFYQALHELSRLRAERRRDEKRQATGDGGQGQGQGDSAKRSQSAAATPAAQGPSEAFRERAAQEAAKFGPAISGDQTATCGDAKRDAGNPAQGIGPQSRAMRGNEEEGDSAKRSQFGAAVPAGQKADSAPPWQGKDAS